MKVYLFVGSICLVALLLARAVGRLPARIVLAFDREGADLVLHGTVERTLDWVARAPTSLHSSAPFGDYAAHRMEARDADGRPLEIRESPTPAGRSRLELPAGARTFELRFDLGRSLVLGETRFGWWQGPHGALALPTRRFLFTAGDPQPFFEAHEAEVVPGLLERGLLVAGPGWSRVSRDSLEILLAPDVSGAFARKTGEALERALSRLAELGVPAPEKEPLCILLPFDGVVATSHFDLDPAEEIYAVEVAEDVLWSTVYSSVARSATHRLARARPSEEALLWRSMERSLAIRLADADGADTGREMWIAALRAYRAQPLIAKPLRELDTAEEEEGWFLRDVIAPVLWDRFLSELDAGGVALGELLRCFLEADCRSEPATRVLSRRFGERAASLFDEVLQQSGYVVKDAETARRHSFPFAPAGQSRSDETARGTGVRTVEIRKGDAPTEGGAELHVAYTALSLGFLDNCGCALTQSGGLPRRQTAMLGLREELPELLFLDLGDFLSPPFSEQARSARQAETMIECMARMGYDAAIPGVAELARDPDWLFERAASHGLALIAANVRRSDGLEGFRPVLSLRIAGQEVRVLGLVEVPYERYPFDFVERHVRGRYEILDSLTTAADFLALARPEEHWIVAGTISPDTVGRLLSSELADRIDCILSGSWLVGLGLPERARGTVAVLKTAPDVAIYGSAFYAFPLLERYGPSLVSLAFDPGNVLQSARARTVPLPPELPRDPQIEEVLTELARTEAGDPATWVPSPMVRFAEEQGDGAGYLGADRCAECHREAADGWLETPHARAISALASRGREMDPACLRCHTTGFLWIDGYQPCHPERRTFENVQCEVCHGPGAEHVEAARRNREGSGALLRARPPREVCLACHDEHNSPGFDHESSLELVHRSCAKRGRR